MSTSETDKKSAASPQKITLGAHPPTSLDPWAIVWRGKWLMLFALSVALGLGYVYYFRAPRIYRSTAQVLLIKKDLSIPGTSPDNRQDHGYGGYEDTLSTHMILLTSPMIVSKAVDSFQLDKLASLRGHTNIVTGIIDNLKPTRAGDRSTPDPNVIQLTYEGSDPDDCCTILNSVIQAYQAFLGDTYLSRNEELLKLISQAKDVLHKQLIDKEEIYRKFRLESPLIWKGHQATNMHESRLAEIESARGQTLIECTQLESRIDTIEAALKRGGNREALTLLLTTAGSNSKSASPTSRAGFEERMLSLMLEEQELLEQYGADHPRVRSLHKRITLIRDQLGNLGIQEEKKPDQKNSDLLSIYIDSMREELRIAKARLTRYDQLFEEERKAAKEISSVQVQDETIRNEMSRTQQLFDTVIKRLDEINLIKLYGGITTSLISPPPEGILISPLPVKVFGAAVFLGLAIGFGLAYLREVTYTCFRNPDEIRKAVGLPVIGHVPQVNVKKRQLKPAYAQLSPMLTTVHHPSGISAEAYRSVRTSLYFGNGGDDHKVIQVTSPNPGDGKTTLATNLAVAIALSNKRVLLLDADFRRPMVHRYFGLSNKIGLSNVVAGEIAGPAAIQATAVPQLWTMPAGKTPDNAADLLTSPRMTELIDELRQQYDYVIVDSPPVLVVSDPAIIAPRMDAVIMVMRLAKDARDTALRAAELLQAVGAKLAGMVVNGIQTGVGYGGYGYGGYRYGSYRYSRYGYKDAYRYGDEPNGNGSSKNQRVNDGTQTVGSANGMNGRRLTAASQASGSSPSPDGTTG